MRDYVAERFGQCAWDAFLATLSREDRDALESVVPARWYPLSLHGRVARAFCEHFRQGSLSIAQELGFFSAERDMSTIHRWCLRLMRPSFVLANINNYWRRGDVTGNWSVDVRRDEVILRLSGWDVIEPAMCHRLLGYLGGMLKLRGPLGPINHSRCRAQDDPFCEFRYRWRLATDAPLNGRLSSAEDILSVERELSHCSDIDALEEAIVHLLHLQLGCTVAHLWAEPAEGGDLVLVRSAGEAGGGPLHCFPIETQGRVIGRLEVELPAGQDASQGMEFIDRLASSFGRLLDAAHASQRDAAAELSRRLARAKARQKLTQREAEVLGLVVLGRSYKEIGLELGCEESTIEAHVTNIRQKCSSPSRSELMAWFWTGL